MAYNGSGTFVRLYNWVTDKANSIKIRADRMDAEMDGFATGLSTAITKDGQTTITANIPFASFKITDLGNGTALTDAANLTQVQNRTAAYGTASGTDTYTVTMTPTVTALATGQSFNVRFTNANTSTATLQVDATASKAITKNGTTALASGDISAGEVREVIYDGTQFQLIGPRALQEDQTILASLIFG